MYKLRLGPLSEIRKMRGKCGNRQASHAQQSRQGFFVGATSCTGEAAAVPLPHGLRQGAPHKYCKCTVALFSAPTMKLLNTLPQTDEECYVLEVLEIDASVEHAITDDALAEIIPYCPNLREVYLSGVYDLSDRTLIQLGRETDELRTLDVSGCLHVSPIGLQDLAGLATRLQVLRLASVWGTTDPALKTLLRSLGHLTDLDIYDLPLVTAHSVREVWTFCRNLRVLNMSNCSNVTDKAFPAPYSGVSNAHYASSRRSVVIPSPSLPAKTPSPDKPTLWIDDLPPLILPSHHLLEHLHYINLSYCQRLTDNAIAGLVLHVPRITELDLAGCVGLTNNVVKSLCTQGETLTDLNLSEVRRLTDDGVFRLIRACPRLRHLDLSCKYN